MSLLARNLDIYALIAIQKLKYRPRNKRVLILHLLNGRENISSSLRDGNNKTHNYIAETALLSNINSERT